MALDKYEVFVKVAETRNLTKTAEMLSYTQSAISHIIKNLEEEVGLTLIQRERSGIRLTGAGERLLKDAKKIVEYETAFTQTAAMLSGAKTGVLTVGSFSSTSIRWMPSIIKKMQDRYPSIEVRQTHSSYHMIEKSIRTGNVDCGFLTARHQEDFAFTPLLEDEYMVVLPQEHYLTRYERIPIEALNDEPFIKLDEGTDSYDTGNILSSISPHIQHLVEDDFVAIPLVEKGLGITILPQLFLDCIHTAAVIKKFAVPRYRTIGIARRREDAVQPLTDLFLATAAEVVENYRQLHRVTV